MFDYESATKDDMTIKKNDQLIVIDKSHPDWWLAKNLRTKETGYVPYNYITSIDDLQIKEYVYFLIYLSIEVIFVYNFNEILDGFFLIHHVVKPNVF